MDVRVEECKQSYCSDTVQTILHISGKAYALRYSITLYDKVSEEVAGSDFPLSHSYETTQVPYAHRSAEQRIKGALQQVNQLFIASYCVLQCLCNVHHITNKALTMATTVITIVHLL